MWMKGFLRKFLLKALQPVDSSRGWIPLLQEAYTGAFQADDPVNLQDALAHPTVYACITQIAGDMGKLRLRLMSNRAGVWSETENPKFSPVLRRPNQFQTRQKFIENWVISKLTFGNAYILKVRDERGSVIAMYVLDPSRVEPLVSDNGSVFYRLRKDPLTRVTDDGGIAPASEIIHDTMECLFHPLVGIPPLYAASLATSQGLAMQRNSASFFQNNSSPGGILTAPGHIQEDTATRIKNHWKTNHSGEKAGTVAVLGDGLKYEPMSVTAKDSTMVDQMKWSDEKICSVYKVPPYKVHVGPMPTYQGAETLDRIYYSDGLQRHLESIEALLDEALVLPQRLGVEFDLEALMRMDVGLQMTTAADGVKAGIYSPNEARQKFNLPPVKGGETPYLQQQNFSLAALDERDKNSPLVNATPAASQKPLASEDEEDQTDKALALLFSKSFTAGDSK